jgi:hypothetical protein
VLANAADDPVIAARETVYERFGPVFASNRIDDMTEADFTAFLRYGSSARWLGIQRNRRRVLSDMERLRSSLRVVLDESRPIMERLAWLWPKDGPLPIPGMGPALVTPILHVAHPTRYGVWNRQIECALRRLQLLPRRFPAPGRAAHYDVINTTLLALASATDTDLWTVDVLLGRVASEP